MRMINNDFKEPNLKKELIISLSKILKTEIVHKKSFTEQAMTVVAPVTSFISRCTTPRSKRKRVFDSDGSDEEGRSNKKPS